jgi:hypothetical protein
MTGPDANTQDTHRVVTTRPLLGVAGVLLGALIATCTGRLMSVGLADIRGALHLGVDEGSWINTTFNASMIFIGPLSLRAQKPADALGQNAQLGNNLTESRLLGLQMHSLPTQPALPGWAAPRRFWGCRFASRPIRWQSSTAFFSWLHAARRAL